MKNKEWGGRERVGRVEKMRRDEQEGHQAMGEVKVARKSLSK